MDYDKIKLKKKNKGENDPQKKKKKNYGLWLKIELQESFWLVKEWSKKSGHVLSSSRLNNTEFHIDVFL